MSALEVASQTLRRSVSVMSRTSFHEDVTNRILDDMVGLLDPHEIEVVGDFTVRGNIKTVITSRHKKGQKKPENIIFAAE